MAVGAIDGVVYIAGGSIAGNVDREVEAYDPKSDTWIAKAPMPFPACFPAAAVVGQILYIVGGGGHTGREVQAYDPKSDLWTVKAPIPTPRFGAAAGVIDGILYVVGGGPSRNELEAYDPKTDSWTVKAPMPTPRAYLAVGVVDGLLYAMGGGTGRFENQALSTVELYDPKTDTWKSGPSMPTARMELAVGIVADVLYAVGGGDVNASPAFLAANEAFSPFLFVGIDIKPGDATNTINLKSAGTVPVAILGSATFDPLTVDPATVTLAGAPVATNPRGRAVTAQGDFNHDGYTDLLLHFRTQDLTALSSAKAGDLTEIVLYGTTYSGQRIRGADSVRVVRIGSIHQPHGAVSRPRIRLVLPSG
ncbi:MAG: Kelch repeat-containing protein [Terriglobia bacterium]